MASNEVRIVVTAEDNASKPIERISTSTVASGVAIGTVMANAGEKILDFARTSLMSFSKVGSELYDLSVRTGMSAETLSELRFAAQQNGVELRNIEVGVQKMKVSLFDMGNGVQSAADKFDALGLTMADFKGKTITENFDQIMGKLADTTDEVTRGALAVKIFGKSAGPELLALMEGGKAGLDELKAKAHELGVTMTDEAAAKADALGDQMDALAMQSEHLGMTFAAAVGPAIVGTAGALMKLAELVTGNGDVMAALAAVVGVMLVAAAYAAIPTLLGVASSLGLVTLAANGAVLSISIIPILVVAAAAAAGVAIYEMVKHWDDVKAAIGRAVDYLTGTVLGAWASLGDALRTAGQFVRDHALIFEILAGVLVGVLVVAYQAAARQAIASAVAQVAAWATAGVAAAVSLASQVVAFGGVIVGWAAAGVAALAGAAQAALAWAIAAAPATLVVIAIAAVVAALLWLMGHFGIFQSAWDALWGLLPDSIGAMGEKAKSIFLDVMKQIGKGIDWLIDKFNAIAPESMQLPHVAEMLDGLMKAGAWVADKVGGAVSAVSGAFKMPDATKPKPPPGTFGGGTGGGEDAAKKMADVMLGIAKVNNKALADAYMEGGLQQSDIVRASQEKMMLAVHAAAEKMSVDLGITLPEATQMMFDTMLKQQTDLAAAQEKIANDNMMAQIDAYMIGGQAAVDIVKQQQVDTAVQVEKMAKGISKAFGIDIDAAMSIAAKGADKVTAAMSEMGRQSVALAQQLWKTTSNVATQGVFTQVADIMAKGGNGTGGLTPKALAESNALLEAANEATRKRSMFVSQGGLVPDPVAPVVKTDLFGRVIVPNVSDEADGGIVQARTGGTLVRVGEGGQDEAIIPLGSRGGMGSTINIYLSGVITDPVATGQAVARALNAATAVVGPLLSSRSVTS